MTISNTNTRVTDTLSTTGMNGANDIQVVRLDGRVFAYVAGQYANTITVLEVFSDGSMIEIDSFVDSGSADLLSSVSALTTVEVNGTHYLYAGSSGDDALTVFEIGTDGTLTSIQTIDDDLILRMDGMSGELTVASTANEQFVIAHGPFDDGLSVFQIGADGMLTNTANVANADDPTYELDNISDTAAIRVGTKTFVFATARNDNAVTVFRLRDDGSLTHLHTVVETVDAPLDGAQTVEVLTIGGNTYLYVGIADDDGISVFEVGSNGGLTHVETFFDTVSSSLDSIFDINVFEYNGSTYLATASINSDTISILQVATDGTLTLIDTVDDSDDPSFVLDYPRNVEFVEIDGVSFLLATSLFEDGVTMMQIDPSDLDIEGTNDNDVLLGTSSGEIIEGLGGDDIIIGDEGDDTIDGGQGSDVITGGEGNDRITGDGDLEQTGSDVETITETGQDLALSVTLPSESDGTSIEISGIINRAPLQSNDFNIVYIIDISGSMSGQFQGLETVADVNGDGVANTLLDGTIEAFNSLNASLLASGFGGEDLAIIPFQSSASTLFQGTVGSDVSSVLTGLDDGGGTDFEEALQEAITTLSTMGPGENIIYFMSDGSNNSGNNFTDEVAILRDVNGLNTTINSVGLGTGSSLAQLDLVDDGLANGSAVQVLEPSALTANLTGSPVETSEVDRLEIYVNGVLVQTLDSSAFTLTPLGLQYDATVTGLNTSSGDQIEVVLVASDTAETEVSVTLTVPDGILEEGDDVLIGGAGDDIIEGNGGNDSLFGETGSDVLYGGRGDDLLKGGSGDDIIEGSRGADTLVAGSGTDTLSGGKGNDLYVIDRKDTVDESTGGGFDTLAGYLSIDLRDSVFMDNFEAVDLRGQANLTAIGNAVGNMLDGNGGDNVLSGNDGDDTINGGNGADTIEGGADNDVLSGNKGADSIEGGKGADSIDGGSGSDTLDGGKGDDVITGGDDADLIFGDTGADTLNGNNGADTLNGGDDADVLVGGNGDDRLNGDDGKDTLEGGAGADDLRGGIGDDRLTGGGGADELRGGAGDDLLKGGDQADELLGGDGRDTIQGGTGSDTLTGGQGKDLLTGGDDADTFVFAGSFGDDTITDFAGTNAEDIDLSGVASIVDFADLSANHMSQVGNDVSIVDGGGNSILIEDFQMANLGAGDFIF